VTCNAGHDVPVCPRKGRKEPGMPGGIMLLGFCWSPSSLSSGKLGSPELNILTTCWQFSASLTTAQLRLSIKTSQGLRSGKASGLLTTDTYTSYPGLKGDLKAERSVCDHVSCAHWYRFGLCPAVRTCRPSACCPSGLPLPRVVFAWRRAALLQSS
jgi:hypothetical protein